MIEYFSLKKKKKRKKKLLVLTTHHQYQLDSFQTLPDGSYIMRFSLFNVPVEYKTGKGSFGGYWVTLDAEYAGKVETVGTLANHSVLPSAPP